MRKITMLNRVSVDGYFASLNEETWGMDWFIPDPDVDRAVRSGDGHVDTLILGGITFRGFESHWAPMLANPDVPQELREVAETLTNLTKIVFSRSMKDSAWANTQLYDDNPVEIVRKLKAAEGSDILIMGSGTIVQQLANEGLIEEYVFIVTPVVAGKGKSLFTEVGQFGLVLKEAKPFPSGNLVLRYELQR